MKSLWYTFDSLVNIRWINKETCEYQRLKKMSFWKIFDFQCICVSKLGCRPSLKSLRTFVIIKDGMTSVSVYLFRQVKYQSLSLPRAFTKFHFLLSKKKKQTNLHKRFHTVTKLYWTFIMMHQTVAFQLLISLSSW